MARPTPLRAAVPRLATTARVRPDVADVTVPGSVAVRCREDLLGLGAERLARLEYLPFYGHHPPPGGELGPWVLSQWAEGFSFGVGGHQFATAEHYLMYRKAAFFADHTCAEQILAAASPAEAKRLGRTVTPYDDRLWAASRFAHALTANLAKFTQHPELLVWLESTRPAVLVEASPTDRIWGVGLAMGDPKLVDPHAWRGENLLGFVLMAVRKMVA